MNFWASWCGPCIEELPLLERTQRAIASRNATVLGVNYKDVSSDALGFVRRFHLSYPSLRDRDGRYADDYASRAFPETFVIDRRGPDRGAPPWPGGPAVARQGPAPAAGGEGMRRLVLALAVLALACAGGDRVRGPARVAARRRGRGDVRGVRDRAEHLPVRGGRPGARVHPPRDRPRAGQGGDQGRAGGRVRPRRAGDAGPRRLQPGRLPRAGAAGPARARRPRLCGSPLAPRRGHGLASAGAGAGAGGAEDTRRLDAELAAYDS